MALLWSRHALVPDPTVCEGPNGLRGGRLQRSECWTLRVRRWTLGVNMSRAASLSIVILCWAAIYLPGLGSLEIKGEEGRRILPAVTMLDTGNYLVPQVGSEPYYRKPPLVNWLVAASFKLTGLRNEWTARLPSVLCVLAVALAFMTIARRSLGPNGSLIAA